MEELRMLAGLGTVAIDSYGQVALQHNPLGTGIVGSGHQLDMEQVLDVVNKVVRGK